MEGESFQVIFTTYGSNVISKTQLYSVIYNVNWGAILPTKYKKFKCNFVFKSTILASTSTAFTDIGFINMNLGTTSLFDGTTMTTNLGIISPSIESGITATGGLATNYCSYCATASDNNDFYINYPTTNQITVKTNNISGNTIVGMRDYVLILNLIGIIEQ